MTEQNNNSGFKAFAQLIHLLGISTKTNDKMDALVNYFSTANDKDKVWTIAMFSGRKPKRFVSPGQLQQWCSEITGYPSWLFNECYHTVGDLSETIALLLPPPVFSDEPLLQQNTTDPDQEYLSDYLESFIQLEKQDEAIRKKFIVDTWQKLNSTERFVFNKLISGNFRIGVSRQLVINALAKTTEQSPAVIAHRISGNWDPSTTGFHALLQDESINTDDSKPYPFYLAYPLEDEPQSLGDPGLWEAEWKWDGIRGQIIKRNNELFVWSRGEELMTDKFPEYLSLKNELPDGTVLDGEIICMDLTKKYLVWEWHAGRASPIQLFANKDREKKFDQKTITGGAGRFHCVRLTRV